jgi:beta-galactosidase
VARPLSPISEGGPDRRQVLVTTASATAALVASPVGTTAGPSAAFTVGRAQPFDLDWRFHRGEGEGFEEPGFDESGWRTVDLPHDWSIEDLSPRPAEKGAHLIGPFDMNAEGATATGFALGGEGWYRKRFRLSAPAEARTEILFEGVYMNSDVWVNGRHLGAHPNGYTPFAYDLTPYLSPAGDNVIAVRVRNLGRNSRWYSGSGIYRHVWLDVLSQPARIARWGVGVATRRVAEGTAEIEIGVRLEDIGIGFTLTSRVKDEAGRTLWEDVTEALTKTGQVATIASPRLWSPETPVLYTLETELRRGSVIIDRCSTPFGVRIVTFDVEGMTINGRPIKLRGGCVHHDNGLLGAAAFDAAEERKAKLLKARGFNTVRPSHNPFSPAFLRACDQHGLMVIAETFDAWRAPKLPQDYSVYFDDQWRSDLTTIVLSARNHPSIILWSIGNEIPARNLPSGVEAQWALANTVHKLDPTRPVTAAINDFPGRLVTPSERTARPGTAGVPDEPSAIFLDLVGYNYKLRQYERDHQRFPKRIIFGSESFPRDVFAIWELTERSPYLLGDCVWAAMDYLGEAGIGGVLYGAAGGMASPGAWPRILSDCGDIDLIGNQKAASLARDVVWGLSPLEIAVQKPPPDGEVEILRPWGWSDERQSWTWPGAEGKALAARVYTIGDRVELWLNGRMLGSKPVTAADLRHTEFKPIYVPGVLEAVAFRGAVEIARRRLTTVGSPHGVRLTPERPVGGAGRGDASYVAIEVVDAEGRRTP